MMDAYEKKYRLAILMSPMVLMAHELSACMVMMRLDSHQRKVTRESMLPNQKLSMTLCVRQGRSLR